MNVSLSRVSPSDLKEVALWRDRAESHLKEQAWDECVDACRKLLQIVPRHHFAQETLATALLHLGKPDEAIRVVKRLLEISPRDPFHRLRVATLLQMQGQHGESLREFERIAAMYPDAPFAQDAQEAIENLDRLQTSQILLMAAEQDEFRWQLERDPITTIQESGFYLSENGVDTLRQMIPGAGDELAKPNIPKIH